MDAVKKDNTNTNSLSSCSITILQIHGYIQQDKVIISINPR